MTRQIPNEHQKTTEKPPSDARLISVPIKRYEQGLAKLCQLEAVAASISGPGFNSYSQLSPRHQESLASLVADLSQDARAALEQD